MSGIAWTNETWNPTVGCTRISPGCDHCYAERVAHRGMQEAHQGLTIAGPAGVRWNGTVRLVPDRLDRPLRWTRPRKIFVDSMSDLFHESIPDDFIDEVFAVMALAPRHTFQVLTKRPQRMRDYFALEYRWALIEGAAQAIYSKRTGEDPSMWLAVHELPNLWLGISAEDQPRFDERVGLLAQTPAAVRFLSLEPLLGPIDLKGPYGRGWLPEASDDPSECRSIFDWVIVGGESGPKARACEVRWIRDVIADCHAAKVPVFVKQVGRRPVVFGADQETGWGPDVCFEEGALDDGPCELRTRSTKGSDPSEWPADLRIQLFPEAA